MANLDAPMGFNPVGKIGSGPSQKAGEYKVTNDAIFQGDAVQIAGNSGVPVSYTHLTLPTTTPV